MTVEQFKAGYESLEKQKHEIDRQIRDLKDEYIASLPFKVNDRVRITVYNRSYEAWISRIELNQWDPEIVTLGLNKPKKGGTRSNRIEREFNIRISEIEVIKP